MKSIEGHEPNLCFLQAPMKVIERKVCIVFKGDAIRRVINLIMQFFERLDRKVGKIYQYVKRRQSGLKVDRGRPVSETLSFDWKVDQRISMYGLCLIRRLPYEVWERRPGEF